MKGAMIASYLWKRICSKVKESTYSRSKYSNFCLRMKGDLSLWGYEAMRNERFYDSEVEGWHFLVQSLPWERSHISFFPGTFESMIFQLSRLVGWDISSFPGGYHVIQQSRHVTSVGPTSLASSSRSAWEDFVPVTWQQPERQGCGWILWKKGVVIRCNFVIMCHVWCMCLHLCDILVTMWDALGRAPSPSFAHRKHMHSPAKRHGRPGQCGTGWCATGMATAEGGTVLDVDPSL